MDFRFPKITETWRADAFEMTYSSVDIELKLTCDRLAE